jgi:X-Pro dipeptidyl-peptidase
MRATHLRTSVLLVLIAGLAAVPAQAAEVTEIHYVPTVDGAHIRLEVRRNPAKDPQPAILTYTPYAILSGRTPPTQDGMGARYVPRGYARAVADVLGTRGSTGCWDYGGAKEQQSGVDVVKYLARLPWSNGAVAMTGGSYDGTTATMVAARGPDVPELKAIVPEAAISSWYGYSYSDGVRFTLNSREPKDEGLDTPLIFDFGFGRVIAPDPSSPHLAGTIVARTGECGAIEHTIQAYNRSPDHGPFWNERDYRKDAANFRAAVLIVHGWQDYNVKQHEAIALYETLPVDDPKTPEIEGVPFKRLWMTQSAHSGGSGAGYQTLVDQFFEQTLYGIDRGVHLGPRSRSQGTDGVVRVEGDWPPPGTGTLALHLGRSFDAIDGVPSIGPVGTSGETGTLRLAQQNDGDGWTHIDNGAVTEELTLRDPLNADGHGYYSLYHESAPLQQAVRIAGSARLDAYVSATTPGQHLTPILVDVAPNGTLTLVERSFLNLDYRNGLATAQPATGRMHATVRFLPQDYTFKAGHRIGLILQGSNTVWGLPGAVGALSYAMGPVPGFTATGTRLLLPTVGVADPSAILQQ